MKHRLQTKITSELFENSQINDEEYIFRDLARRMVTELPIDELHKLIKFTKTDPNSEHSKRVLWDLNYPSWQRRQVHQLRNEDVILYEADIEIKEWITETPEKEDSYLCFMDNGYIKMCYYNGKEWFDMWETTLKGTVKKWQPL